MFENMNNLSGIGVKTTVLQEMIPTVSSISEYCSTYIVSYSQDAGRPDLNPESPNNQQHTLCNLAGVRNRRLTEKKTCWINA